MSIHIEARTTIYPDGAATVHTQSARLEFASLTPSYAGCTDVGRGVPKARRTILT